MTSFNSLKVMMMGSKCLKSSFGSKGRFQCRSICQGSLCARYTKYIKIILDTLLDIDNIETRL